ncbi:MAG: TFIIB-type zinc ribbon-containing protein [Clostridia bacterium]|nr:TFIIB-type zinc ribbon-containing protein [Clostridia bacterium]
MVSFKCPNCGGEMSVSRTGDLLCSYCGTKQVMSDAELQSYKDFRYRMLVYLSAIAAEPAPEATERIWAHADSVSFTAKDGSPIAVSYLFSGVRDGVRIYTARRNVLFVFPAGAGAQIERFRNMPKLLQYPPADVKGLSSYFPTVNGIFELKDGRTLVSVSKSEECFPLSAFGSLPAEHAAWIVSRLENLCCVLAFSDLAHGGIDMETVFINARTHEAYLPGGWWNAQPCPNGSVQDLRAVRSVAKRVMGMQYDQSAKAFRDFIKRAPAQDAYADFAEWDRVITEAFGGRQFRKLDLSNLKI